MGLLVAQGAAGVSGVLRADVQPWTDAALLCASVSTALAEIVRRTAIFLPTPPGVKGDTADEEASDAAFAAADDAHQFRHGGGKIGVSLGG